MRPRERAGRTNGDGNEICVERDDSFSSLEYESGARERKVLGNWWTSHFSSCVGALFLSLSPQATRVFLFWILNAIVANARAHAKVNSFFASRACHWWVDAYSPSMCWKISSRDWRICVYCEDDNLPKLSEDLTNGLSSIHFLVYSTNNSQLFLARLVIQTNKVNYIFIPLNNFQHLTRLNYIYSVPFNQ